MKTAYFLTALCLTTLTSALIGAEPAAAPAAKPAAEPRLEWGPWYTIGPFDNKNRAGFDTAYPPEKGVDFSASCTGMNSQVVSWKSQPGFSDGKDIDLLPHFSPNTDVAVYLARRVTASEECKIRAIMGSDDTLTVWVNGQQCLSKNVLRPCQLGDECIRLTLRKGENTILLKVCQGVMGFGFAFQPTEDGPITTESPEVKAQFDTLEAIRTGKRPSSRFAKPELTHRAESLIQGTDRDPVDIVLRRTAALLKDLRRLPGTRDLSAEAAALAELQKENERVAVANTPSRRILHARCCELRRTLAFANPLLDFDKIVFITHKKNPLGEGSGDHMAGQYYGIHTTRGEGLFVLTNAFGATPGVKNLLTDAACQNGRFAGSKLPDGAYLSPDLSFDGKSILFAYTEAEGYLPKVRAPEDTAGTYSYSGIQCSFTEKNSWHLFRVSANGTDLRNVTDGPWNDFDPCWMPNGRIAFISDRRGGFGRCHCSSKGGAPWFTYTLHAVDADGRNMVRLSHHETCEWQPSITHEGLLVYTRWDYIDRGFFQAHHPWTTTPDGRNAMALHGNYPKNYQDRTCMEMDIRSIPNSKRLVATAAAHHGQTYGSIVLVDPQVEDDDAMAPVRLVTPEERFPESEYGYYCREAAYGTPWPLSEDYYLCVYGYPSGRTYREPNGKDGEDVENYGIYLLDSFGNKELLYRDPKIACLSPIPLKARPTPPVIAEQVKPYPVNPNQRRLNLDRTNSIMAEGVAEQKKYAATLDKTPGIVSIANVYESRHPWPKDTRLTALRIVQILPKSAPGRDNPKVGYGQEKNARAVLGTVPVEADGSVHFKLPPYIPVYFQVLNEQGLAVQSLRSEIYVAPQERLSCVGCHEQRHRAPPAKTEIPLAMRREPSTIQPEMEGSKPFNFTRLVQPVLDAKCVACHSKESKAPALSSKISDKPQVRSDNSSSLTGWTESYLNLRPYAFYYDNGGFVESKTYPGKFGALASRLYGLLQKGHHDVKLTPEELRRITLWLDCNSDFYGAYYNIEAQARGEIVEPILE
ncbi:MAG: hypothetical protein WCR06_10505 [bacterium]